MLSCGDVCEQLAAIETGEPAPGEVRDHLATCEACRREASAVRADIETLRGELASLAPSPFLEDSVLQDVRAGAAPVKSRRAIWLPAGIGVGAAAVLALLVFVAKLPNGEHAAGDGEPFGKDPGGPSLVDIPPTQAQVAAARKARLAKRTEPVQMQFYGLPGAPPAGMVVVGRGLLARLVPKSEEGPAVQTAFDRLTQNGRQQDIDITVGAPGWKGAAARVRARISDHYSGNLIVPEVLGRALGLHEHERLVHITVGGDTSMTGERARARVRIADRELETDVEVLREHVALPAVPLRSGGIPPAMRVEIRGEQPQVGFLARDIGIHHAHGTSFVVATATVSFQGGDARKLARLDIEKAGPWQAALGYHAGKHPECLVFLPSLDIGGGGILAWALRMERVTLTKKFAPGADVTIARVWRGRTAIPSRESVAHTKAAKDGTVSFVHQRGELGPLRLREVRADGSAAWHEIAVAPQREEPTLRAGIEKDGEVHLDTQPGRPLRLDKEADRRVLREILASAATRAGRDARGISALRVLIRAQSQTPWRYVERLLLICADPRVKVTQLRFATADGSFASDYELPVDPGLVAPSRKAAPFDVRVLWRGGRPHWSVTGVAGVLEGPVDDSPQGLPALTAAAREVRSARGVPLLATIKPVGAARKALPYATLRKLIVALGQAGIDKLQFMSTPPRKGR